MSKLILAGGFVIAGLPFTGMVGYGIRYALDEHGPDDPPSWYGWTFAASALAVGALFALAAFATATGRIAWRTLFIASLVTFVVVGLVTLGQPLFLIPLAVLTGISYLFKKRTSPGSA